MVSVDEFVISSANHVPGYNILETKGFVYGLTVRSRGIGGDMAAGLKSIVGGKIGAYVKMMEETREEALKNLLEHAKAYGANGLISVRFDSNDIANAMQEVLAYGTAVVVEKE